MRNSKSHVDNLHLALKTLRYVAQSFRVFRINEIATPATIVYYQRDNFTIPARDEDYGFLVFHRDTSQGHADTSPLPLFLKTPQEDRNEFEYTGKALHQALSIEHV